MVLKHCILQIHSLFCSSLFSVTNKWWTRRSLTGTSHSPHFGNLHRYAANQQMIFDLPPIFIRHTPMHTPSLIGPRSHKCSHIVIGGGENRSHFKIHIFNREHCCRGKTAARCTNCSCLSVWDWAPLGAILALDTLLPLGAITEKTLLYGCYMHK